MLVQMSPSLHIPAETSRLSQLTNRGADSLEAVMVYFDSGYGSIELSTGRFLVRTVDLRQPPFWRRVLSLAPEFSKQGYYQLCFFF